MPRYLRGLGRIAKLRFKAFDSLTIVVVVRLRCRRVVRPTCLRSLGRTITPGVLLSVQHLPVVQCRIVLVLGQACRLLHRVRRAGCSGHAIWLTCSETEKRGMTQAPVDSGSQWVSPELIGCSQREPNEPRRERL